MIRRRDFVGGALFTLAAGGAALGSQVAQRHQQVAPPGKDLPLAEMPDDLGPWKRRPAAEGRVAPVELDGAFAEALAIYDLVLEADYVAASLPSMMVNIAYKREIRQEQRFHWPEFCYATQGYDVTRLDPASINLQAPVDVARFLAKSVDHLEIVAYLIKVGRRTVRTSMQLRRALFMDSLALKVPDGALFRASMVVNDVSGPAMQASWATLMTFMESLLNRAPSKGGP